MVECALNNTWSQPSSIPFFFTRLLTYPTWIPILTARKAVNLGWICTVYPSLVKVPGQLATYRTCIYGHELLISPTKVAAALDIAVKEDYVYPIRTDRFVVSFDVITK